MLGGLHRGHGNSCGACSPTAHTGFPRLEVTVTNADYTAYSYLIAGEDYRSFELAPEFGRVPPYSAALTEAEQERAHRLLRDSLVISLHDHPVRFPARMEEAPEYNRTGRQHAAYAGLAASGLTVVFDNMMDGTACVTGNAPWRWNDIITDLGMRLADLAHQSLVTVIRTVADIDEAHRSGRIGLVFGLESATPIENEIDRLDVLYGQEAHPSTRIAPAAGGPRSPHDSGHPTRPGPRHHTHGPPAPADGGACWGRAVVPAASHLPRYLA
jgi:Membrane dipeptidase (Peptidase family M19)